MKMMNLQSCFAIAAVAMSSALVSADTVNKWTFENTTTGLPSADPTPAANLTDYPAVGTYLDAEVNTAFPATPGHARGHHASATSDWYGPSGNGSSKSFSSNGWGVGDYYEFITKTTGYTGITFSWAMRSSSTGPANFKLQYSTNGTTFVDASANVTSLPNASYLVTTENLPAGADNQAQIFFRVTCTSTISASAGTIAATGTNRIDDVTISGTPAVSITGSCCSGVLCDAPVVENDCNLAGGIFYPNGVCTPTPCEPVAPSGDVLANWTFDTTLPTSAGPFLAENGLRSSTAEASAFHSESVAVVLYDNPSGNGTSESFSSDNWLVNDYYQFTVDTTGYENILFSWNQNRSAAGPSTFDLQYRVGNAGSFTTLTSNYNVAGAAVWSFSQFKNDSSVFAPVSAPGAANSSLVQFRLVAKVSGTVNGGLNNGTNRVDNIYVTGTPATAVTTGACCNLATFICTPAQTLAQCTGANLQYQGDNTTCLSNPCPVAPATGACCTGTNNTACSIRTQVLCVGGSWKGANTVCGTANNNPIACCRANHNQVNGVTVADIFSFLSAWFAGNISADYNLSGTVTVQDIFGFLSGWFAGCPNSI